MDIPYGHQSIDDSDVAAVAAALRGEWLTMGPGVVEFENAISRIAGSAGAVAVSSGTAARTARFGKSRITVSGPITNSTG